MKLVYAPHARDQVLRLALNIQQRIVKKMQWFAAQDDPLAFAKRLTGSFEGHWRFRVGDYRVICIVTKRGVHILEVVAVKNRKEAYRDIL